MVWIPWKFYLNSQKDPISSVKQKYINTKINGAPKNLNYVNSLEKFLITVISINNAKI